MNWLHPLFKIRTPQEVMGRSVAPLGEVRWSFLSPRPPPSLPIPCSSVYSAPSLLLSRNKPLPMQTWGSLLYLSVFCCQHHIKPLLPTSTPCQPVICPMTLSLSQASPWSSRLTDPLLSCCSGLLSTGVCRARPGLRAWPHVTCAQSSLSSPSCTLPWVILRSWFCSDLSILCLLCTTLSRFSRVRLFVTHDWSPPGSSVHEILQARLLEWVAMFFSRGSSWPRDGTCISYVFCIGR